MKLSEYQHTIHLDRPFVKNTIPATYEDNENSVAELVKITNAYIDRKSNTNAFPIRQQLRANLNVLPPFTLSKEEIEILNSILQFELKNKSITDTENLIPKITIGNSKLVIWKGDITHLKVDAIVNAANSQLQGCFIPLHNCIDNAIHSAAGVQLRDDCTKIIAQQNHPELTADAKITRAYNLPSTYVVHTVGPIVKEQLIKKHETQLYGSYQSCLNLAAKIETIRSIAFCCISTGVFGFPRKEAAKIAVNAVKDWLNENLKTSLRTIVFNVFDEENSDLYQHELDQV